MKKQLFLNEERHLKCYSQESYHFSGNEQKQVVLDDTANQTSLENKIIVSQNLNSELISNLSAWQASNQNLE
ncbi:unnamed protein product, partial [Brachionus calyciflorus]